MERLGELIRKKRKELNYSQNKLAKIIEISQPFMAEIESGRKKPSIEILTKLCNTLGLELMNEPNKKDYSEITEQSEDLLKLEKLLHDLDEDQLKGLIEYAEFLTSRREK